MPRAAGPHRLGVHGDGLVAVGSGEVGHVDQAAQYRGDLAGLHRVRIGRGEIFQSAKQMGAAKLVVVVPEFSIREPFPS